VSRPVLNQTVATVSFSTAPRSVLQKQTKAVCEECGSGRAGRGGRSRRAFTRDQMTRHLDDDRSAAV